MKKLLPLLVLVFCSCMKWEYGAEEEFDASGAGLFILCEGNFQYGNSSLSFYSPDRETVENEVFAKANGMKLGDVAQSMTIYDDKGWIVVNNSHVIFAIDTQTFREKGRITNLTSPRYIHFVSAEKAYVTQLWDNRIFIVNPKKYEVTGYIQVPDMTMESGSTEQMVQIDRYVYCTCWSYQNRILKIDTETDRIVGQAEVGIQPRFLVKDRFDRLWTLTDGGYEDSPYGYETPALVCLDPENLSITKRFQFRLGETPTALTVSGDGGTLYWINDGVWSMEANSDRLPVAPVIQGRETKFYGLTVSPESGDIYVGDAIDYQQPGMIYRYCADGSLVYEFYVGVTPGAFCWKK